MDIESFLFVGGDGASGYAKDKEFVYFNCDRIPDADPETFEFLEIDEKGNILGKDKNRGYTNGNTGSNSEGDLLHEGDTSSDVSDTEEREKVIAQDPLIEEDEETQNEEAPTYMIQGNKVYFGTLELTDADSDTFEILSEEYEGNAYGRDEFRYYKNEELILGSQVPEEVKGEG